MTAIRLTETLFNLSMRTNMRPCVIDTGILGSRFLAMAQKSKAKGEGWPLATPGNVGMLSGQRIGPRQLIPLQCEATGCIWRLARFSQEHQS